MTRKAVNGATRLSEAGEIEFHWQCTKKELFIEAQLIHDCLQEPKNLSFEELIQIWFLQYDSMEMMASGEPGYFEKFAAILADRREFMNGILERVGSNKRIVKRFV